MTKLSEKMLRVSPRPTLWVLRQVGGIPVDFLLKFSFLRISYFCHLHFDTSFGLLSVRGKATIQKLT